MARRIENNKGFLIIEMTPEEAIDICGFGCYEELICDDCNERLNDYECVYYIPVLSSVFCKQCYIDWVNYATRYDEDIEYETKQFNHYAKLLNII